MPPKKLTDAQLERVVAEIARRARRQGKLATSLLEPQRKFIEDKSRLKAAICPRRSGKSYAIGLYLVLTALQHPGCNMLFVGKTRQHAKDIIWKDILRPVLSMLGMSLEGWNKSELSFTFHNGSVLRVTGADTTDDVSEKFRGAKYKLAVFDECASWRLDLKSIIYDKVWPAMADELGTVCMIGTPGNVRNFFYQVTTGAEPGWSVHRWTWQDNPHVKEQVEQSIAQVLKENPLRAESPAFRQEWYGEWTVDESKLIYNFNEERNRIDELPKGDWMHVLGVDWGHADDAAWVVLAYTLRGDKHVYVVEAVKQPGLGVGDQIERTRQMIEQYRPVATVCDHRPDIIQDLQQRYGLDVQKADKVDKSNHQDLLNNDLVSGVVKLLPGTEDLVEEFEQLVWDEKLLSKVPPKRFEDPRCPNHLCDALLYAWRRCRNYAAAADPPPVPGRNTDEWADQYWQKELDRIERRKQQPWWEVDEDI